MRGRRTHLRALLCAALLIGGGLFGGAPAAWAQSGGTSLDDLGKELTRLQQDVQKKNREIKTLLDNYERQGGRLPQGFGPELNDEQRRLLAQRFQQERLGLGATLQDILDRDREIATLQRRIAEIESMVATSVIAKPGDTHQGLVRAYLSTRGLSQAEMTRLMLPVSFAPTLTPGNRVWILVRGNQLGTWVTAGDSRLPNTRPPSAPSGTLIAQRDAAVRKARALELAMEESERERTALRKESAMLRADIGHWAQEADQARQIARAAVTAARFVVGSKDELRQRGIIAGNWIRGTHVQRLEHMEMLDLTQSTEIVVRAADHGMPQIDNIELLPGGFVFQQDYIVYLYDNGAWARVILLNPEAFKASAFVVMVE